MFYFIGAFYATILIKDRKTEGGFSYCIGVFSELKRFNLR